MSSLAFPYALVLACGLAASGCGHSHSNGGGASSPSHSSGSSFASSEPSHSGGSGSSHSGGGSHVNNTSYLERSGPAYRPAGSGHTSTPSSKQGSSGDDTGAKVAQAIAAGVIDVLAQPLDPSLRRVDPLPATHPETPCEAALREFWEMHPDGNAKVPPQLRCGANGEWGLDHSPTASAGPATPQ